MIHDFDDHDVPLAAIAHDRVEEPPERRQVLHEQVVQPMPVLQGLRYPVSVHALAGKAVGQENRLEGPNPAHNGGRARVRTRLELLERLCCRGRQDDVLGPQAHYSLGSLRIASRSSGEASGTQIRPLLPSAIMPWSPRKFTAAFKLCLVVEWPQCPRVTRSRLRLTGPLAFCSAARTYSIVARVGFAPGLAYLGRGAFATCAMMATISIHIVYVSFHPRGEGDLCP